MSQIQEYLLKLTGSFPVQELNPSKEIKLTHAEIAIYEVSKRDNRI